MDLNSSTWVAAEFMGKGGINEKGDCRALQPSGCEKENDCGCWLLLM